MAKELKKPEAMTGSTMAKAKICGLVVDKKETTNKTFEDLLQAYAERRNIPYTEDGSD